MQLSRADRESVGARSRGWDQESPYKFFVKGERAGSDSAFFELLLAKVLLQSGTLANFDEIWPRGAQALAGMNIFRLSRHSAAEMKSIIAAVGGEFSNRLGRRAKDLVIWADAFWRIKQVYGSFRGYIRSFDADGYEALIGDLSQRLVGLSPGFLLAFLRESGEKIPVHLGEPRWERATTPASRTGKSRRTAVTQSRDADAPRGGRRRLQRGRNQGKRADTARASQPQDVPQPARDRQVSGGEKSASRGRRGRRGFFRRKREGRGHKPKDKSAAPASN